MAPRSRTFLLFLLLLLLLAFGSLSPLFFLRLLDRQLGAVQLPAAAAALASPPPRRRRNLTVLLWHWPFGRSYRLRGNGCLSRYNVGGCALTDDVSAFPRADVVVFHHQELSRGGSALPLRLRRPAGQRWVWLSMEPPANNANLSAFNGLFNWTMSYRRDADVSVPYGRTLPGRSEPGGVRAASPPNASCLASWVVSKYRPDQARARLYQSLKELIPIEVYGRWNGRPLAGRKLLPTIARCPFYLALENSQTRDYISEKLWRNAFQAGVVPVVLGPSRATYEALAPPRSFIHAEDFGSATDLAVYLKALAADRRAYEGYFLWRRSHRVQTLSDWRERLCQICAQFPGLPGRKVYQDLELWVNG